MADQFVKLDYIMLDSAIFRSLSRPALHVYIQIKSLRNRRDSKGRLYNRKDSHIEVGFSDIWGVSKKTYVKAVEELRIKGFIQLVRPGRFPRIKAVYAISQKWKVYNKSYEECKEVL